MRPKIREASSRDLQTILQWLKKEHEQLAEGSFYVNNEIIEKAFHDGELFALIDADTRRPIGFLVEGASGPDILAVKANRRGEGHGRRLAEFSIARHTQRDAAAIDIQCAPETSVPFWNRMGFKVYSREPTTRAVLMIPKKFARPSRAARVGVTVTFYPGEVLYRKRVGPLHTELIVGWRERSGGVGLPHRVAYFHHGSGDLVIAIEVDGSEVYRDKAKYEEAQRLGVRGDGSTFHLDQIELPSP